MKILQKINKTLILSALLFGGTVSFAQVKIGNNPTVINANAVLDVESATKGILFPRLALTATTNPSPLAAHVAGMQVYNTAAGTDVDPGIYYNDGTKWIRVGADAESVFLFGPGAPTGSCTTGTMYVDTLEDSNTEGNTWSCVGGAWVDYVPKPNSQTTAFYLANSTSDAKGNKSSAIYRQGFVGLGRVRSPRASLHSEGTILMTRNNFTHSGLANGTHAYNGVVNYYNASSRVGYVAIQNIENTANLYLYKRFATNNDIYARFAVKGDVTGSITRGGGLTVLYNTTSDARLKENVKTTRYGIADLMKIAVKDYNYIVDKKTSQTGFIAQELHKIYPEAVSVGGNDAKTNPWGVDYAKITPLLVKAIQDQQAEIEKLKSQNLVLQSELGKVASLTDKIKEVQAKLAQLLAADTKSVVVGN